MKKVFCDKCNSDITVNAESKVNILMEIESRMQISEDKDLCRTCMAKLEHSIREIIGGR